MKALRRWNWPRWMIAAALVAGLGFGTASVLRAQEDLKTQLDLFGAIFFFVKSQYVDPVENKELIEGAINGMLETLDPHTVYLPRDRYANFTEQFREDFSGIGIQFDVRNGQLIVVSPLEGTPAYRLGMRAGDRIVEVDGKPITEEVNNEEVRTLLRGPEGSRVRVVVERPGLDQRIPFDIERARIPQESVRYAHMIRPGVGYVRIIRFASATSKELDDALKKLRAEGMERLVVDLRFNSGGLLQQAVEVSNHFLPSGSRIVDTRGRTPAANAEYFADNMGSKYLKEPMIVLIDHGSASASEILAGAVQDLDRGLVVGTTSFGKGLVQNQMRLNDGSALLLTVAKYYTPSGRLIQRDYSDREAYREDVWTEDAAPESILATRPKYNTTAGRTVYGGGGITPDIIVSTPTLTPKETEMEQAAVFFEVATELAPKVRGQYKKFEDFLTGYLVDDAGLAAFRRHMDKAKVELSDEEWNGELSYVRRRIKAEIAGNLYGRDAAYRVNITGDDQIQRALSLFPEASKLLTMMQPPVNNRRP